MDSELKKWNEELFIHLFLKSATSGALLEGQERSIYCPDQVLVAVENRVIEQDARDPDSVPALTAERHLLDAMCRELGSKTWQVWLQEQVRAFKPTSSAKCPDYIALLCLISRANLRAMHGAAGTHSDAVWIVTNQMFSQSDAYASPGIAFKNAFLKLEQYVGIGADRGWGYARLAYEQIEGHDVHANIARAQNPLNPDDAETMAQLLEEDLPVSSVNWSERQGFTRRAGRLNDPKRSETAREVIESFMRAERLGENRPEDDESVSNSSRNSLLIGLFTPRGSKPELRVFLKDGEAGESLFYVDGFDEEIQLAGPDMVSGFAVFFVNSDVAKAILGSDRAVFRNGKGKKFFFRCNPLVLPVLNGATTANRRVSNDTSRVFVVEVLGDNHSLGEIVASGEGYSVKKIAVAAENREKLQHEYGLVFEDYPLELRLLDERGSLFQEKFLPGEPFRPGMVFTCAPHDFEIDLEAAGDADITLTMENGDYSEFSLPFKVETHDWRLTLEDLRLFQFRMAKRLTVKAALPGFGHLQTTVVAPAPREERR